jgi:ABC-2 type transport system permease protein
VAPLLATRALSMGLAGTDYGQHHDFAEAAELYRRRLVKTMNDAVLGYGRTGDPFAMTSDSTLWAQVPPFRYEAQSLGTVLQRYRWAFSTLVAWLAGALAFALAMARGVSPLTLAERNQA